MSWSTENTNPLYQQYINTVDMSDNDNKWLKKVDIGLPFPSESFTTYSEEEFFEKLESDKEFNDLFGELKISDDDILDFCNRFTSEVNKITAGHLFISDENIDKSKENAFNKWAEKQSLKNNN